MPTFEVQPLEDLRWASLVESHPKSSVFHSPNWIKALEQTYGYRPAVFTTSPPGSPLTNGIVCCQIRSWLTGSRYVSLPFSDHCEPLTSGPEDFHELLSALADKLAGKLKYVEIRPRSLEVNGQAGWLLYRRHYFHSIDLRPEIGELESHLDKDSIRRKIRRAEREQVVVDQGRSDLFLKQFYELLLLTRRRHRIPPQPFLWFRNLAAAFEGKLTIRVARVGQQPIASILTLRHKRALVYKYGCSDAKFHNLGAMPLLFWRAICDSRMEQLDEFDLGRSDESNPGLVRFKDNLGAQKTFLSYWRFSKTVLPVESQRQSPIVEQIVSHLPTSLFRLAGKVFYRHVG